MRPGDRPTRMSGESHPAGERAKRRRTRAGARRPGHMAGPRPAWTRTPTRSRRGQARRGRLPRNRTGFVTRRAGGAGTAPRWTRRPWPQPPRRAAPHAPTRSSRTSTRNRPGRSPRRRPPPDPGRRGQRQDARGCPPIAYLIGVRAVQPRRILAVTFTNRAAGELRERIIPWSGSRARRWRRALHACAPASCGAMGGDRPRRRFVIYDTDDQQQLMKRILAEEDCRPPVSPPRSHPGRHQPGQERDARRDLPRRERDDTQGA